MFGRSWYRTFQSVGMFRCGCRIGVISVFDVYNCLRGKLMNTFHALGDIGLKEVVTRNTASALSALFVTIQISAFRIADCRHQRGSREEVS